MNNSILIPLPLEGHDPTEAAIPWKELTNLGHKVVFATVDATGAIADQIMVTGQSLGVLKHTLRADENGQKAYQEMVKCREYQNPLKICEIDAQDYRAIVIPGGHAKGIIPYLESRDLQKVISAFHKTSKPIGAICHGVIPLARTLNPSTGKSILYDRSITALPAWMENCAYYLTKWWKDDYYKTYPGTTTQEIVSSYLRSNEQFKRGPLSFTRDSHSNLKKGFCMRDKNILTARWPGDVHLFAKTIDIMIREK